MKQLTDEQYVQIGLEAHQSAMLPGQQRLVAAGRAAYEAAYPLAIEEALSSVRGKDEQRAVLAYQAGASMRAVLEDFVANRLARLTAKPDPAVEAVMQLGVIGLNNLKAAENVVAAVRASDAKAGRA